MITGSSFSVMTLLLSGLSVTEQETPSDTVQPSAVWKPAWWKWPIPNVWFQIFILGNLSWADLWTSIHWCDSGSHRCQGWGRFSCVAFSWFWHRPRGQPHYASGTSRYEPLTSLFNLVKVEKHEGNPVPLRWQCMKVFYLICLGFHFSW